MQIDYSELTNEQLLTKLDDAVLLDRFENQEDWKLIQGSASRLAEQAEYKLLRTDPIKNPTAIIEYQITIKFCRNVLKGIINGIKNEGRLVFDEIKDRGLDLPLNNL